MKKQYYFLILISILSVTQLYAQTLKPYILGVASEEPMDEVKSKLKTNLELEKLDVIGEYAPANDKNRWVMVINSEDLSSAVQSVKGLAGFAATLRVAITKEEDKVLVSYTNPAYWGNAYFRSDFPKVEQHYKNITTALENAMKKTGEFQGNEFGSEKGVDLDDLRKYRYMFGMPRFDDVVELNKFSSYSEAVSKIEANIQNGKENVRLVYSIEIPYDKLKLYGFALEGEDGESSFLPKIDILNPKHTAFLPYEMLVVDGKVFMLHGRFRIALSFPDLTMGTFTKIMSTPGNISDLLKTVTE